MTEHMSAKERAGKFREHYACGGREMPKPHGRKSAKWDKEDRRDATHSKD
jgi:hypothetical protein